MKKSKTFRPIRLLALIAGCISLATAAPYGPEGRETSWTQPDGQVVNLRVFGDEYYARTETPAGFTLFFNDANNTYYYAKLSADGKSLVSTGVRADEAAPAGLAPHIDIDRDSIKQIAKVAHAKYDGDRDARWVKRVQAAKKIRNAAKGAELSGPEAAEAKINAAPVLGDIRGLTILIQFPNDSATSANDAIDFPVTRNKIVRFCNEKGYSDNGNTGSVRDFYSDQSLGRLTYTQTVTQIVTVPHPRNYYNYSNYPSNTTLADPVDAAKKMITDAVNQLQAADFDFSNLTTNGNRVVATNIFFAGPDSGVYAQGLWPHQSTLTPTINVGNGAPKLLANYQITNIANAAPVIGTFCHENGHLICGYPDIYSAFDGEGVGRHCLMGSGNYLNGGKTPSPINAYFKDLVGWGEVTDIAPDEFLTAKLPSTGNVAYRIFNQNLSTEFFMVENRGNGDRWAQYSDDKGIAIWHIDEKIDGNNGIAPHYGVALEQADGRQDLENGRNRGDDTDLFDLSKPKFTDNTNPNARWWNGQKSFIDVEVVSDIGANTTVAFGGVPPDTIIVGSPNGGEIIFKDSSYPIAWKSNIVGNVKIDLYKAGQFLRNIAPNEPDDGSYDWAVPSGLAPTNDYRIVISSVSSNDIFDQSDNPFMVTNATFPRSNELPYGWFKPKGSQTMWEVTKTEHFEGKSSLVSGKGTGDGKKSGIAYRSNFEQGVVSFYIKVSSEAGFDFARFSIDDVPQSFTDTGSAKGISGNQDWKFYRFNVSKGTHTFTWTYEKDDSYAALKDAAWIDGVTLPVETQDIAVQQPEDTNLVDAKSTTKFPDIPVGEKSKPITYTIKNTGKADLIDLQVGIAGENPTEFTARNLKKAILKPGTTTTFEVLFAPKDYGTRNAILKVFSNDPNEGIFSVALKGEGIGLPLIGVVQPVPTQLADGDTRNFGIANVGSTGNYKIFTVVNKGAAVLNELVVTKTGANKNDFSVGPLGVISLDPGDSTTFKVTFKPTGADVRTAILHIGSNDEKSGPFEIVVTGKGSPVARAAGSSGSLVEAVLGASATSSSTASAPATEVEVVDGQKYLSLTVAKVAGGAVGVVEVSPNLIDWYSGSKHTTILIDDAKVLKVRDNTPVTQDAKRYIRLK